MATAEVIPENLRAVPLYGDTIQGSIQEFVGVPVGSSQSHAPFYVPEKDTGEAESIWSILACGATRSRRRFEHIAPKAEYQTARTLTWDRLNLDLMRIASLEPNWDGEDAEPVSQKAATNAGVVLSLAKAAMEREKSTLAQCTFPTVTPDVEGGVILKWVQGNKELKCIVRSDAVEVIRWRSLERYESDGFWEIPVQKVAEHFEWLLQQ